MAPLTPRLDPERAWVATVLTILVALVVGTVAFPRRVYDGFIWRYFWGPVEADAHGAACAVRHDGSVDHLSSAAECTGAVGVVAEPGYTTVSTISYAAILLLALVGVYFLLRRFEIGNDPGFFFALVPFMFFGGALRVVEDVNVVMLREGSPLISFPWSGLIISPLIYFTVFFITLAALLGSLWLDATDRTEAYVYPLSIFGSAVLVGTLGWLAVVAISNRAIDFNPIVPVLTLGGATIIAAFVWESTDRYVPSVNDGTGLMGAVVIWGHAIDGIANVISLDWNHLLGLPGYAPKHVVNRAIIDVTEAIQPAWMSDLVGTAWPFLLVKVAVATFVVWVFDEQLFDESPRYGILLLVAILAVGIGPGTRDFLRATLGI